MIPDATGTWFSLEMGTTEHLKYGINMIFLGHAKVKMIFIGFVEKSSLGHFSLPAPLLDDCLL